MRLLLLEARETIEMAARWPAQKTSHQSLDFGDGWQVLTASLLEGMARRDTNLIRVCTADPDDVPIGIVGLSNVERRLKTRRCGAWQGRGLRATVDTQASRGQGC